MKIIKTFVFIIVTSLPLVSIAKDQDGNGIQDKFDLIIKPLPTAEIRVAGRQMIYNLEELLRFEGTIPVDLIPQLALSNLIAHECFEHARLTNGSTISNTLFWFAAIQIAGSEEDRSRMDATMKQLSPEKLDLTTGSYQSTYERLSPFQGEMSGCDHLN